ncbi:MAG TPA: hypothetical protein VIK33_12930 [Anaerolineae bacterium]
MRENKPEPTPWTSVSKGLAQGSAIGLQAGCLGAGIVIGALVLGLGLDGLLQTRPLLTLALLLVSAPVSVYAIYRFALRAARKATARERSGEDTPQHDRTP